MKHFLYSVLFVLMVAFMVWANTAIYVQMSALLVAMGVAGSMVIPLSMVPIAIADVATFALFYLIVTYFNRDSQQ